MKQSGPFDAHIASIAVLSQTEKGEHALCDRFAGNDHRRVPRSAAKFSFSAEDIASSRIGTADSSGSAKNPSTPSRGSERGRRAAEL
jgi:hypothetical protein